MKSFKHCWTKAESQFLQDHAGKLSVRKIAKELRMTPGVVRYRLDQEKARIPIKKENKTNLSFSEVLFFYFFLQAGKRCKELGIKPDVIGFLNEYRRQKNILETSETAQRLRRQWENRAS